MFTVARTTTRNATLWRDGQMVRRWTGAGMLNAQRSFRRIKRLQTFVQIVDALRRGSPPKSTRIGHARPTESKRLILYVPTPLCIYTFMYLHLYAPTPLCTYTPAGSPPRDHSLHQHGNVQSRKRARSASSPARKRSACALAHVLPCRCDPKDHSARAAQSQPRDHAQARPG